MIFDEGEREIREYTRLSSQQPSQATKVYLQPPSSFFCTKKYHIYTSASFYFLSLETWHGMWFIQGIEDAFILYF